MRHADQPEVVEEIRVDAAPDAVWPVISDITLPVGPSPELQAVEWLDDGPAPAVGRRFIGTNRNRYLGEWRMTCTIVECDPPSAFAWVAGDPAEPASSWQFSVVPDGDGSIVRQRAQLGIGESGITYAIAAMPDKESRIIERRLQEWRAGLQANLAAVEAAVRAAAEQA